MGYTSLVMGTLFKTESEVKTLNNFCKSMPVLQDVQNVKLYRMEIVQYRDELLQIPQMFYFKKSCII